MSAKERKLLIEVVNERNEKLNKQMQENSRK
jgi:hypothetical protein